MKKKIFITVLIFLIIISGTLLAETNENVLTQEIKLKKNTIYLYGLNSCPHCQEAKSFLNTLVEDYDVSYKYLELSKDYQNEEQYFFQKQRLGIYINSVPLIVLGDQYWIGYNENINKEIREVLNSNNLLINKKEIGKGEKGNTSLLNKEFYQNKSPLLSTIMIGFIDGFNPCSLWVLTVLLGFLVHYKSRKKMFLIGITFLLTTALVYGLFITGILKGVSYINHVNRLSTLLGLFVLVFGFVNLKDFFFFKKGISATISKKNKNMLIKKMRDLINTKKKMPVILLFTVLIALMAAIVELPCTSGFPVIWSNIIAENGLNTHLSKYAPLILVYLLFYLTDELIIFGFALKKLSVKKIKLSTGKNLKLIMGYIMMLTGLDILLKTNYIHSFNGLIFIILLSIILYYITKKLKEVIDKYFF